jgi:hypothetical protein
MQFMNKQLLIPGQCLSRRDIAALFGGNTRAFLPKFDGEIVAGCFDPKMNPRAPYEILVSSKSTSILAAKRFVERGKALPIFVRRAASCWEYLAEFHAVKYCDDRNEVNNRIYEIHPRVYQRFEKAYGPVRGVLFLEEAT